MAAYNIVDADFRGVNLWPGAATNAVVFSPAIYYRTVEGEAGENERSLITGLNLGLKFGAFYVGYLRNRESADPPHSEQTSHGPSVGLIVATFDFIATNHVFSERDTGTRTLKDGSGIQFAVGKKFMLSPNFGLGPRLSFSRVRYRREVVAGVESEIPGGETVEEFSPTFALIVFF